MQIPDTWRTNLVIALVGAAGTDLDFVADELASLLRAHGYRYTSKVVLSKLLDDPRLKFVDDQGKSLRRVSKPEDRRIRSYMDKGTMLRHELRDGSAVAMLAIEKIFEERAAKQCQKCHELTFDYKPGRAWILKSLKNPAEVDRLRRVYGTGFYLIGVHQGRSARVDRLADLISRSRGESSRPSRFRKHAEELVELDFDDRDELGQKVSETFHLADVFVSLASGGPPARRRAKTALKRFVRVMLGATDETPSRDENAMFFAHSAALRSGDLSRQVGAVLTDVDGEVRAIGCNEVAKAFGGQYWAGDKPDGRDLKRGRNFSLVQRERLLSECATFLREAGNPIGEIPEITSDTKALGLIEFFRAAHAEAAAILSAGRAGIPTVGTNLYTTTFPCHDCAKLILAAGIAKVIYVEPYTKSLAEEMFTDSISTRPSDTKISFVPFEGVGPRLYVDMFSLRVSTGGKLRRQDSHGDVIVWEPTAAMPRLRMLPTNYVERELEAMKSFMVLQ
jgi:deoxycytidylate deaminase